MMQKKNWIGVLVLVAIAGITYLPLVSKLGYINDDWYLMYDGYVGGADFFHEVYSIDRPLRGYLMQAAFSLFRMDPLYYHLSAFVFRVLSAIGLLWLCNQLWKTRKTYNLLATLLFLIYPGFLSQVNPIDYQSQIFSLACGMFSVALTIKAIHSDKPAERVGYAVLSIALAWIYLGLVDYFLGFEALRLIAVGVVFWRDHEKPVLARLRSALWAFAPFLLGAGGFLVWRLFLFETERRATDVSVQLSALFSSPLTGLWWLNYLIQDVFKVLITAWAVPLNAFAFSLRLRDMFLGFALAIAAVVVVILVLHQGGENEEGTGSGERSSEMREQVWIAMVTIIAGLIPVIIVNRHVILPEYSRYALASSVGVAILLSVIFEKISVPSLRTAVVSFFVAIAVLTHYGNAWRVAIETDATRNFWWQAAWRAPQIKEGATLIASYPGGSLSEDYFVWGPANLIYYPGKQNATPLEIKLPAAILTSDVVLGITTNGGMETPLRRGNYLERDFGNVLVMIQSTPNGCVRFINGDMPELSPADDYRLFLTAPHSKLDNVITEGKSPIPPALVFGKEPERSWCYYYQKADLARQRGEWDTIPVLLKEALDKGYYPDDSLEWMPFLQAHAVQGDVEKMRATLKLIAADRFLRLQACEIMMDFKGRETLTTEVEQFIQDKICE
jgi:hypothetical protein